MKSIPSQADFGRPSPGLLTPSPARNELPSNFRRPPSSAYRAYPFLLVASTLIAAAFCFLYITKPVIRIADRENQPSPTTPIPEVQKTEPFKNESLAAAPSNLLPGSDRLPGDAPSITPAPVRKSQPAFEETNLTVQHVLTARIPAGDVSRLVLDVPVLYQSRNLRWTQEDVSKARDLLAQLSDYQEKSVHLRTEGHRLLTEWNQLISRSIPAAELRADSPSLPVNQRDPLRSNVPSGLDSGETIQLKPSGK